LLYVFALDGKEPMPAPPPPANNAKGKDTPAAPKPVPLAPELQQQ
jgi:hypothetical protein